MKRKGKIGQTVDKNIRYRGEMQYFVEIRRKGGDACETFVTLDEARIFRDKVLSQMRRGNFESPATLKKTTFGDLIDEWLKRNPLGSIKDINRYKHLKKFSIAKFNLYELESHHFVAFRDSRLKGDPVKGIPGRSNDTVRNDLFAASKLYKLARTEWGYKELRNPLDDVAKPVGIARDRRLRGGEENHLMTALKGGYNKKVRYLVLFAIESAMRRGEALELTWDRVNLEARKVTLRARDTKTNSSRTVVLSKKAVEILREVEKFRLPNQTVFQCSEDSLRNAWEHIIKRARKSYEDECKQANKQPEDYMFEGLRYHDLRHEATSRFVETLQNLVFVQSVTGHKTLAMLQRYAHADADKVKTTMDERLDVTSSEINELKRHFAEWAEQ